MTSWRNEAACQGADPRLFFPTNGGNDHKPDYTIAAAYCTTCPVREACLDDAINTKEMDGYRGGMAPSMRRRLRTARRKAAAA